MIVYHYFLEQTNDKGWILGLFNRARRTPSDAGRRPAHPGCPILAQELNGRVTHPAMRAKGLRLQDAPLYGLEACAPRNPMGASHTQRCGPAARTPRMSHYTGRGLRAQEPNGGVTHLAMRAGGPRAQDVPLYGPEACARRRESLSAGNYVVIECNLKPKAANPLTHLIVASTSSQTRQTVVYQAVIEQRESDRFQSQDRWGLSESAPRPE